MAFFIYFLKKILYNNISLSEIDIMTMTFSEIEAFHNYVPSNEDAKIYWHSITEYITGGCYDLAVILHKLTGFPIFAEVSENNGVVHAWVVNNDGQAIDIYGLHETNWAKTELSSDKPLGKIVPYPVEEQYLKQGYKSEYTDWTIELIKSNQKHFCLA